MNVCVCVCGYVNSCDNIYCVYLLDSSVHDRLGYPDPDNDALLDDMGEDDLIIERSPQVSMLEVPPSATSFR